MKKIVFLLLSIMISTASVWAVDITVDNTKRNYLIYVPNNLGEKRPLLISCHGMNQDAAYQKGMLQIESIADTAKFVTVFPNGINKSWDLSGNSDIHFVEALIDEMEQKYNIDRNCVYLSGFSMGGMFTYHAMNRIADKIAAFAPISGYPMWGGSYTSARPVPIIHTHGTSDDVVAFNGVQSVLNGWIQRNGCPATAQVTKPYRANHITRHVWGPGENGVEVVLMELAGKGHWISNDIVKTGEEIWLFCKRFSLEQKDPTVKITTPQDGLAFTTIGGPSDIPPLTIEATASDPDGVVAHVSFYDGDVCLAESSEAPYTCILEGLTAGEHHIRAVATDDEGRTGSHQIVISVKEPTGNFVFTVFQTEGCVPSGWTTYDGEVMRTGLVSGLTSGCRTLYFTSTQHDFDRALYVRNIYGRHQEGYARFAGEETPSTLMLYPGNYRIYYRIVNWNQPDFSPITIALEDMNGQTIGTETFTPSCNIGNSTSNNFTGTTTESFNFDVTEKGRYRISFYTADSPWADMILSRAAIHRDGDVVGITPVTDDTHYRTVYYHLSGQQTDTPPHGLYIEKHISQDGKVRSQLRIHQ